MNSIQFTRWLRTKQLPILLSILLLAVSVMQSLHDQSHHDVLHATVSCEYCVLSQGLDAADLPDIMTLHRHFSSDTADIPYLFSTPLIHIFQKRARAPPQLILS